MFNPAESEDVVQSLKRNYGRKFNSLDNHDLASSFDLLEKHGHLYDNKLIEDYIAPKSNKEELIKKLIDSKKASLQAEVEPRKELQGRQEEIKEITRELETDKSVVNLFGSARVGKTTLANEVCLRWRGKHFVFDLREAKDTRAIYRNMMNSLGLTVPVGFVDQSYVVTRIHEKIKPFKSEGQSVLFLLDNVDQFTSGLGKEGKDLKIAFVQFLERLSDFDGKDKNASLKLLLTSRTQLEDAKKVGNFEVKSLASSYSEKILVSKVMTSVNTDQKNQLIDISKGKPLLLKGLAATLRQERKSADDLIADVHKDQESKSEEDAKERPLICEEEGVDMGQLSAIIEMFHTLPTENLKEYAVSISLFRGPFSASTAAKILGISVPEALAQLEGLVTSAIIFVVDEEAKERKYDIHPLLRKYVNSIKDNGIFQRAYLEARGRFHQHFMSKMEKIAKLIETDYVRAFELFESDRPNYEFTLDISLQPKYFSVPGEFHENALIASLFNAMLTEDKQIKLFHSWAEMCDDDGHTGSLCRAQLKCWEAQQVLDVEGTEKAFKVLEDASRSLENVQDKSSESYTLSKGLYLRHEGEAYWRNQDYKKSLDSLKSSLEYTEQLLKVHTDVARCYNAIGNCYYALDKPMKALDFYKIAYDMQEELAGGEYHFDMPTYKNQIGIMHESQGDYDKAVKYYKDALKLLHELKRSGFQGEALFCRNLANVLMLQKKHREAVELADRAYNIRMKILGNHPLTVGSIFQRAVIQANFGDYKEALKLFLEAWEMEKSLAAGNHSEVWRKIITGVEDMYDFLGKGFKQLKKFLPLAFSKKEQFKKEALKFCQRFWKEQREGQFGFTNFNKEIIDAIVYLSDNKKDKYEAEKDALWFYDGMQNATEGEFQEEFDQETNNSRLNEVLKERDEFSDKVIELCLQVADHEKLTKHRNIKMALFKKVLLRPDFVGEKESGYDKATLKGKVEQLYRDLEQKENIPEFRENLSRAWQKQWEEGKERKKTKKTGVARERMINGILQLCKELKKTEMFRRYGREALSFYEDKWEKMHAEVKPPGIKKFLHEPKELASSIGDPEREKNYNEASRDLKKTGEPPWATLRPKAKQLTSKSQKEEEEEEIVVESEEEVTVGSEEEKKEEKKEEEEKEEEEDEDEDEEEVDVGAELEIEVGSMEEIVVAPKEKVTEVGPDAGEVEERSFIYEGTVTNKGSHWELTKVSVHVIFPPDAVSEDRLMTLHRWKPSVCSPPLQENEALVSDVVELSTEIPEGFGFNKEVTLAISHSADVDLKGYEVVVKQLIDRNSNEWEDVDKTVDIRFLSDLEEACGSDFPDYLLPVAETQITQCSTYVVVCRLKSHVFTITSEPATLSLPDYPLVTIVIPQNAVHATETFHVTVKVQEFPSEEIKNKEMLAGPILRISCDREIEFQQPVTVQLPKSLREKPDVDVPDLSLVRARVLSQQSDGDQRKWTEIMDRRELHPSFYGTVTTFNVRHFSGFWSWLEWCATPVGQMVAYMQADHSGARQGEGEQEGSRGEDGGAAATAAAVETSREEMRTSSQPIQIACDYNTECVRQAAAFTACLPSGARLGYNTKLSLYCCPNDKRRELIDKEDDILLEEESAWEIMKPNDKAYVFLSGDVIRPVKEERLKDLFVRFIPFQEHHSMKRSLRVHVVTTGDLTIEFCSSRELEIDRLLCRLEMELPPPSRDIKKNPVEFFGVPLNDSVLTDAPLMGMLGACKGVLEEIKRREIYDKHFKRSEDERAAVTSFFTSLAKLSPDDQQECFDAIVSFLEKPGDGQEGIEHVAARLRNGKPNSRQ